MIDWWWRNQVIPDVARAIKGTAKTVHPMLVWTGNYTKTHICLRTPLVMTLIDLHPAYDALNRLDIHIGLAPESYSILPFATFLHEVKPEHFRSAFLRVSYA